jgi:hypothetical protein
MDQPIHVDPTRYEKMYADQQVSHGLPAATPWDIGGPQPVVRQLVALGAIKGEVLDGYRPGPPRHLLRVTGVLGDWHRLVAGRNRAGKGERAESRRLGELPGGRRDDTGWFGEPFRHGRRLRFLSPLFRRDGAQEVVCADFAPSDEARLYMFEHGPGNVNGYGAPRSLSMDDFLQVFPDAGWEITFLWPTTYHVNISVEAFDMMIARNPDKAEQIKPERERFRLMQSWLPNGRVHAPFWEMHATRVD